MTDLDIEDIKEKATAARDVSPDHRVTPYTEYMDARREFEEKMEPSVVLSLIAEIDRCHVRLEIDRVWHATTGGDVPKTVPYAERRMIPDGIECRDETIRLLDERISRLRALLARAGEALKPFHLLAPGEALGWADEHGWTDRAPKNERICDWFGPTNFRTARTVAAEIEKEIER